MCEVKVCYSVLNFDIDKDILLVNTLIVLYCFANIK